MSEKDPNSAPRSWHSKVNGQLSEAERLVVDYVLNRRPIARNIAHPGESDSLGARMADKVASFGGSWAFIGLFCGFLVLWTVTNILMATRAFDPYPFIFLNLVLSMVAALQAPIIMMSQNRQAQKDRLAAAHDYEVNLQAELEIMALHAKLDQLREEQHEVLVSFQREHIAKLTELLTSAGLKVPPEQPPK